MKYDVEVSFKVRVDAGSIAEAYTEAVEYIKEDPQEFLDDYTAEPADDGQYMEFFDNEEDL